MTELRWTELAADVVAWHNRNPLARHIRAQHVHSLGYVMLPFVDADAVASQSPDPARQSSDPEPLPPEALAGSLRERAMARAKLLTEGAAAQADDAPQRAAAPARVRPAFDEDFLPPHRPKAVQRWASRQAVAQTTPRGDVQVRKLRPEAGVAEGDVLPRWVLTAQVEVGRAKTRVLVGPGSSPAVLGRRLISPARSLAVFALVGLLLGTGHWLLDSLGGRSASAPQAASAAASATAAPVAAASSPASASRALPGAVASTAAASAASTAAPGSEAASAAAAPPSAMRPQAALPAASAPVMAAPLDVEPRLGQIQLPSIGPRADERRRRAQEAAAAAASAALAQPGAPAVPATPPTASTQATPPRQATPRPAATGPAFAVTTRLLRTRSESEQVAAAMRELLSNASATPIQVEVLPAGDDWRVVGWPYADRALADKARALLASRGMRVQVIEF